MAVTLVRLRELQGAVDVSLDHSTRGADDNASTPAAPASASSGGDAGCGTTDGKPNYSFEANVTFAPPASPDPDTVPDRLGGGA